MITNSIDAGARVRDHSTWGLAPWFSRLVMAPAILIMVAISFRYIWDPAHAASPTGVVLSTPEALTDTRVVGGFTLSLAVIVASAIFSQRRLRMGHAILIAVMGLVLAVRLYGFMEDGTTLAMGDQKVKTIGEIVFLVLNSIGFAIQTLRTKQNRVSQ